MDTALNNNKNINDFCLRSLRSVIKLLSVGFKASSSFSLPKLTRNIIRLPFFVARPCLQKTHFSFCRPGPFEKLPVMRRHGPARLKNHASCAGPARWKNYPSSAGPGPCRFLVQTNRQIERWTDSQTNLIHKHF